MSSGCSTSPLAFTFVQRVGVLRHRRRLLRDAGGVEHLLVVGRDHERRVVRDPDDLAVAGERRELRHVGLHRVDVEVVAHRVEPAELAQLADPGPVDVGGVGEVGLGRRGGADLGLQAVPVDVHPVDRDAGLLGEVVERGLRRRVGGQGDGDRHAAGLGRAAAGLPAAAPAAAAREQQRGGAQPCDEPQGSPVPIVRSWSCHASVSGPDELCVLRCAVVSRSAALPLRVRGSEPSIRAPSRSTVRRKRARK